MAVKGGNKRTAYVGMVCLTRLPPFITDLAPHLLQRAPSGP